MSSSPANLSPAKNISRIDREIDAIHKELCRREVVTDTAASWQRAWDRHPELREQERRLFQQRGAAQRERDEQAAKVFARRPKYRPAKKCPTCGAHTLHVYTDMPRGADRAVA